MDRREALLEEFAQSGLSAAEFAKLAGVNEVRQFTPMNRRTIGGEREWSTRRREWAFGGFVAMARRATPSTGLWPPSL